MRICKNCNIECADDAKFCQECGYRFTDENELIKVCQNCNTHNPETSKFCQECGEPFNKAPEPAQIETVSHKPPVINRVTRVDGNISHPTAQESEMKAQTESKPVSEFNVAEILAKDPYYDDIPLEDKGETKIPIDKENLKKAIFIVIGTLLFVVAITVALVITS